MTGFVKRAGCIFSDGRCAAVGISFKRLQGMFRIFHAVERNNRFDMVFLDNFLNFFSIDLMLTFFQLFFNVVQIPF